MNLTPYTRVVKLLETLADAETAYGTSNDGGGLFLMPTMYNDGSYAELQRCMRMMQGKLYKEWWNVSARYLWITRKTALVRYRKTVKGRIPVLPPRSELYITGEVDGQLMLIHYFTWSANVSPARVQAGIEYLVATMHDGDTQRITLPHEVLQLALAEGERYAPQAIQLPARNLPSDALAEASRGW